MSGLGRGLGSLIPSKINNATAAAGHDGSVVFEHERIVKVAPNDIKANPQQPRKNFSEASLVELVDSIREHGIIQPLIVTRSADGYELIAGERRLRAAKKLALAEVPVIVRRADEQKKLEWAIIENIQRSNLNPLELAQCYKQLANDFNLNQEALAKRLGKARSTVANTLRILNLPADIQTAIADGLITEGHAKILIGLDSEVKQHILFKKILANQLSVADTVEETKAVGGTKQARPMFNQKDRDQVLALARWFGTKVNIKRSKRGGVINIAFGDDDELAEIMKKVK